MVKAVNLATHPDFSVDELVALSGWAVPSPAYKLNMAIALAYFQRVVPRQVLRSPDDAGPWNLRIAGVKLKLLNWMQGINFHQPVNPLRAINRGDPLVAFKSPEVRTGRGWGSWYAFPSTKQDQVAIHSTQTRMHKFKVAVTSQCMQSTVADAYVAWVRDMPAEYRHGGAQQLFIWNAQSVLTPA